MTSLGKETWLVKLLDDLKNDIKKDIRDIMNKGFEQMREEFDRKFDEIRTERNKVKTGQTHRTPIKPRAKNKFQSLLEQIDKHLFTQSRRRAICLCIHQSTESNTVYQSKNKEELRNMRDVLMEANPFPSEEIFQFLSIPEEHRVYAQENDPLVTSMELLKNSSSEKNAQDSIRVNWMQAHSNENLPEENQRFIAALETSLSTMHYPQYEAATISETADIHMFNYACKGKPGVVSLVSPLKLEIKSFGRRKKSSISDKEFALLAESLLRTHADFTMNEGMLKSACLACTGYRAWCIVAVRTIENGGIGFFQPFIQEAFHLFQIPIKALASIWYTWNRISMYAPSFYRMDYLCSLCEGLRIIGYNLAYCRIQILNNSESSITFKILPAINALLDVPHFDGIDSLVIKYAKDPERGCNEHKILSHLYRQGSHAIDYVDQILNLARQSIERFEIPTAERIVPAIRYPPPHATLESIFHPDVKFLSRIPVPLKDCWFAFPFLNSSIAANTSSSSSSSSSFASSSSKNDPPVLIVMREGNLTPAPQSNATELKQLRMLLRNEIHEKRVLHTDIRPTNVMWFESDIKPSSSWVQKEKDEEEQQQGRRYKIPRIIDFDLAQILEEGETKKLIDIQPGARKDFLVNSELIREEEATFQWDATTDAIMVEQLIGAQKIAPFMTPVKESL